MKNGRRSFLVILTALVPTLANASPTQDWPQWRGANRDGKAAGFNAPKEWPKELTQKWKITVGDGVATPALVGDKLYVFSREEGNEVIRCLEAATGKELWQDKYESLGASGPASGFSGPRSSPTVTDGKVVTFGVRGMLSCYDAAKGTKLWRKETGGTPRFFTSSSPIVVDGLCIVQVGGESEGGITAFTLANGEEKWKWTGDGSAYASPVLLSAGGQKVVVAETAGKIVGLNVADGKLLWETPYQAQRMSYNASTPIVVDSTLIYSGGGRGTKAVKLEKDGDNLIAKDLWTNPDQAVQFNSPVLKDGFLYGLTGRNQLFCINAQTGETAWAAPLSEARPEGGQGGGAPGGGGQGGPGGGRRRGGGGGGGGYGSIVDAGSVLVALTPASELVVFQPNTKEYTQVAKIKVAGSSTHAYPVLAGNRIFIKDKDSLTLFMVD